MVQISICAANTFNNEDFQLGSCRVFYFVLKVYISVKEKLLTYNKQYKIYSCVIGMIYLYPSTFTIVSNKTCLVNKIKCIIESLNIYVFSILNTRERWRDTT